MKFRRDFLFNGIILTLTSLFIRWCGVLFNSYLIKKVGAEGIGVYTLVQSVYGLAVTFACSGINLGTTRLISEAMAKKRKNDIKRALLLSFTYALLFSTAAFIFVFFFAKMIGNSIIDDNRTVASLKILAFSLPFISISSVFSGYFSAVRKAYKNALVTVIETFLRITVTVSLLKFVDLGDIVRSCALVSLGAVISELCSVLCNCFLWMIEKKDPNIASNEITHGLTKKC